MTNQIRGEGHERVTDAQVGTNAGVTATLSTAAGKRTHVTHISGSSDAAALVTIESPAGTIKWRRRYAAAFTFAEHFKYGEYTATDGSDIIVKISASTTNSEANIAGFRVGL